jgi:hypothetical protein
VLSDDGLFGPYDLDEAGEQCASDGDSVVALVPVDPS